MGDTNANWISGTLFFGTIAVACALLGILFASPALAAKMSAPPDLLLLFGRDMTVRRTGFAAALGLFVTAFVFFRPVFFKKKKPIKEVPINMTGA